MRGIVQDYLHECGFLTKGAASADEAMRLLNRGAIDIVFSDVRMPGKLDGCGLARWVMENKPDIPVLLVSGYVGKLNAANDLDGTEILSKPYDFPMVADKIRSRLEQRAPRGI